MKRIPFPRINGEYVTVYRPKGDVYLGEDSLYFKKDTYYDHWTANDFSIINDNGNWHLVGITHPTPPVFTDEYHEIPKLHDAEHMLFHATASGKTMADVLYDSSFTDEGKILYPFQRPNEIAKCHAPHILKDGKGGYNIFYGPQFMRVANTADFKNFTCRTLFEERRGTRDPFVFEDNGLYYFVYVTQNRLEYRITTDFVEFSDPKILHVNPWRNETGKLATSESPYLFKRKGFYYLLTSLWDARAGTYDHRGFLYGSDSLEGITDTAPIAMFPAHAGEFYSDESGDYLLSVFHPENGINIAPVVWENDID